MRAILFLIGGVVLANITWATFFWRPKAEEKTFTTVNSATKQGQEPWMVNEKYNAPGRDRIRKSALETLGKPWSEFCTTGGHKSLIDAINYYYGQRRAQVSSYGNTYGEAAKRYAIKMWQTADDNRIERMMRETYGRGYFALEELGPVTRAALAEIVKGERVTGAPCRS